MQKVSGHCCIKILEVKGIRIWLVGTKGTTGHIIVRPIAYHGAGRGPPVWLLRRDYDKTIDRSYPLSHHGAGSDVGTRFLLGGSGRTTSTECAVTRTETRGDKDWQNSVNQFDLR